MQGIFFMYCSSIYKNSNDSEVKILPTFELRCDKLNFVAIVKVCRLVIGGTIVDI